MIPVEEAKRRMLAAVAPLPAEIVSMADGLGRVLAGDVAARVTQPWAAVSAMDGYAVRAADVAAPPVVLRQVGEVPAGRHFAGRVGPGECVRIFTGAPLPAGTDAILIQEDADADGLRITAREAVPVGRYVRPAGLDFEAGQVLLPQGRLLTARDVGLAAAMNVPWLRVHRRPRVAILATGDEIVLPGDPVGPNQIVSANGFALAALVAACGGVSLNLGVAPDDRAALRAMADEAAGADLLITTGGASVGAHDLVRDALAPHGLEIDFWRIAMRPGKPLMFGRLGATLMLGLPGNPVSTMVCGILFAAPILRHFAGLPDDEAGGVALLGCDLPANDTRQDYLRATLSRTDRGEIVVTPFARQDSSMMSLLAQADCLVVRPPRAPPARSGEQVPFIPFAAGLHRL